MDGFSSPPPVTPEIGKFRKVGIDPELEDKLTSGTIAKGNDMWAPSAGFPPPSFFEGDEVEEDNEIFFSDPKCGQNSKRTSTTTNPKKKQVCIENGGASMLSSQIKSIHEAMLTHNNLIMVTLNKMMPPSITEAIEILDSMELEVPRCGDMYLFALRLFQNKGKREIFVALKENPLRLWYLQSERRNE